ncbi:hypothetical protein J6TS7_45510 [Paenibacillus dendritiformis]|nr:hypothetical protein J6TS7_45510 [Paenibacillus dendritiformis]
MLFSANEPLPIPPQSDMSSRERKSELWGYCFNNYPNGADLTRWENDEKSQQKAGTAQTTEG